jgi:hypothetical protein
MSDLDLTLDLPAMATLIDESSAQLPALLRPQNDWTGLPFSVFDPDEEPPALEYVWRNLAAGKVSAIVAYAYTAKTPFALLLAICVARGIPFLGEPTRQRKAVYLAFEGARNARRKAQRLCRGLGFTLAELPELEIVAAPSGTLNGETTQALCVACRNNGVGLVVIDTYGSALDGNIERNSSEFSDSLKQLGTESDASGILFVVLLHQRKGESGKSGGGLQAIDGHNSVAGALQAGIELTRPAPSDKTLIEVRCVRAADDEFAPFNIRWVDVADPTATNPGAQLATEGRQWGLRAEIAESEAQVISPAIAAKDEEVLRLVFDHLRLAPSSMRKIRDAVSKGFVGREGVGRERLEQLVGMLVNKGTVYTTVQPTAKGELVMYGLAASAE